MARADEALAWASGKGAQIVTRFKRVASVADDDVERGFAEAARALIGLAQIAKGRNMADAKNWDMACDWAEQALGMLETGIGAWLAEHHGFALE